jgi:hypothetical protein
MSGVPTFFADYALKPDVALNANGGQGGPASLPIKQIDDEHHHDRTPLFDQLPADQLLVSGRCRRMRKMVSSAGSPSPR